MWSGVDECWRMWFKKLPMRLLAEEEVEIGAVLFCSGWKS